MRLLFARLLQLHPTSDRCLTWELRQQRHFAALVLRLRQQRRLQKPAWAGVGPPSCSLPQVLMAAAVAAFAALGRTATTINPSPQIPQIKGAPDMTGIDSSQWILRDKKTQSWTDGGTQGRVKTRARLA